jgi:hypothetical protein
MIDTGGRPEFAPGEEAGLLAYGYSLERLERLKIVIKQHHGGGQPAIKQNTLAFHLRALGFQPDRILNAILERALYHACRNACLEAEATLGASQPLARLDAGQSQQPCPLASAAREPARAPASGPMLGELSHLPVKDFRADGRWDDKLCRQATSTLALFELLTAKKPSAAYTQEELANFRRKLRLLPKRYDMTSPKSREIVVAAAEERPTGLTQSGWAWRRRRSTVISRR